MTLIIRLPYTHGNKLILYTFNGFFTHLFSFSTRVSQNHTSYSKLLSGGSTVLTKWGEHSVHDWVSMYVRNLSERVLFSG